MNIIFTGTYITWLLSEILLNRFLRSKSTDKKNADKNSLSIIWITIIVSITIATYISSTYPLPIFSQPFYEYIGIAIIIVGIVLRFAAIISLGKFFTVDVTIRQGHILKKDGLYKYLRHPSYFASLLSFIGFGISLNNWLSFIIITVAIIIVFSIRVKVEEKVLIEQFGEEYLNYKKATWGFIPFVH
ncbi:MAG: isoprenylcysteine carboxylmethyltransferase family protein [Chitinophagaceae bacterium]|nr:isoprenylcysteine carboxylmethyltransferase family protein [Chitinophagaceae bacterium]